MRTLAEYDASGARLPDTDTYDVRKYPLTRKVLDEHTPAVVNVDDPRADAAEVATLRAGGDRSLLMLPLVYRGEAIGLLEASDARRARSYSRQELRLCQAVAGQAAVALHNTSLRAASRSGRDDLKGLCAALRDIGAAARRGARPRPTRARCSSASRGRPATCWGRSRASSRRRSARPAPRGRRRAVRPRRPAPWNAPARDGRVLVGRDASGDVSITATLRQAPSDGVVELLDLLATVAAARLSGGHEVV